MFEKRVRLPILFLMALLTSLCGATEQKLEGAGLPPAYNKWVNEDVQWIIGAQEKEEFLKLATNEARDSFISEFWERRNPNPDRKENPFKEEHYRRIAYSNAHFAAKMPGWKTDRGRVYIVYGPPDSIIKHSSTGANPPEEIWSYLHMPGAHGDVSLHFIDHCVCGEYALEGNLPKGN